MTAARGESRLPPGQYRPRTWPVLHYGPLPKFRPAIWDLRVFGATAKGEDWQFSYVEFQSLPVSTVRADLHCVTKFSILDNEWRGVLASTLLDEVPPADDVSHVMVWAEYGYGANMPLVDFAAPTSVLATHHNGEPLTPEHGWPVRMIVPQLYAWKGPKWVRGIEYLTADRRGFWEERGYHNRANPWREQRYSYQERPGDGPPL